MKLAFNIKSTPKPYIIHAQTPIIAKFLVRFSSTFVKPFSFFSFFPSSTPPSNIQLQLQHSLVSEIRDIVYPEDRLRFDELMFRHGVTVNVLSNNVATLYGRSGVCSIGFLAQDSY